MPRLFVLSGPETGATHDLAGRVVLGRGPNCDVRLRHPSVSRRHASLAPAERGDAWLQDMVYSAVPASQFGLEQIIEVGPMSGINNIVYWLTKRGLDPDPEVVDAVFKAAKASKTTLTETQIREIVQSLAKS